MRYCKFHEESTTPDGKKIHRCCRCRRSTPHPVNAPPDRVFRRCSLPGLGGLVTAILTDWGITKDRVSRWQSRWYGKPIQCGCLQRETTLDRAGDAVVDWLRSWTVKK